jgi:hypothetical protein
LTLRGALRRLARQRFDRLAAGALEGRLSEQILRRIAGDDEFAKDGEIRALRRRLRARGADFRDIAGDMADDRRKSGRWRGARAL